MKRPFLLLAALILVLFAVNLTYGSVQIPTADVLRILFGSASGDIPTSHALIVSESRLPAAVTALFAGGALAVSGLLLQSVFNNPLAGPSILGIDSGAGLGVALMMLLFGSSLGALPAWLNLSGYMALTAAAFAGAALVLGVIIFFSTQVKSNLMLLIIGIMVSYFTSAVISVLNFFASEQGVFAFTMWGMGDFSSVSRAQLPFFCTVVALGLLMAMLLVKPLNALLLGQRYAENLGVNVGRVRILLLLSTGLLTAVTTAFCGPIAFIGLAVPHIARLLLKSANRTRLLPMTLLCGSATALLCNFLSHSLTSQGIIPLNAITPLIGVPVIIYVIIHPNY